VSRLRRARGNSKSSLKLVAMDIHRKFSKAVSMDWDANMPEEGLPQHLAMTCLAA
jgi:hypothetical protein